MVTLNTSRVSFFAAVFRSEIPGGSSSLGERTDPLDGVYPGLDEADLNIADFYPRA